MAQAARARVAIEALHLPDGQAKSGRLQRQEAHSLSRVVPRVPIRLAGARRGACWRRRAPAPARGAPSRDSEDRSSRAAPRTRRASGVAPPRRSAMAARCRTTAPSAPLRTRSTSPRRGTSRAGSNARGLQRCRITSRMSCAARGVFRMSGPLLHRTHLTAVWDRSGLIPRRRSLLGHHPHPRPHVFGRAAVPARSGRRQLRRAGVPEGGTRSGPLRENRTHYVQTTGIPPLVERLVAKLRTKNCDSGRRTRRGHGHDRRDSRRCSSPARACSNRVTRCCSPIRSGRPRAATCSPLVPCPCPYPLYETRGLASGFGRDAAARHGEDAGDLRQLAPQPDRWRPDADRSRSDCRPGQGAGSVGPLRRGLRGRVVRRTASTSASPRCPACTTASFPSTRSARPTRSPACGSVTRALGRDDPGSHAEDAFLHRVEHVVVDSVRRPRRADGFTGVYRRNSAASLRHAGIFSMTACATPAAAC